VVLAAAFSIRLHAVMKFGRVIHEFDPWFNYRATEYLEAHGWTEFFNWFDESVWYPIGRPVGTTIYPGLQITSVAMYRLNEMLGLGFSLNDVCVFVPAIFGAVASFLIYLITVELSGSKMSGILSAGIMAIIPSHLMRSVAGGYDNESLAVSTLCATFLCWIRAVRHSTGISNAVRYGIATGFMYIYMVAAWGAYTFVLNMIGVHAAVLVLLGRYSERLHTAYSIFYVIGTYGAIHVPVVGLAPLKSLEQLGPMGVFLGLQVIYAFKKFPTKRKEIVSAIVLAIAVVFAALPKGYFGPLSSRVRGLFVQHTKTGNPLVDSVAEHQATRDEMYWAYFHIVCFLVPVGIAIISAKLYKKARDSYVFILLYVGIAYYFSKKMVRLVLLLAPPSAVLGGIALASILSWCIAQFSSSADDEDKASTGKSSSADASPAKKGGKKAKAVGSETSGPLAMLTNFYQGQVFLRRLVAVVLLVYTSWSTLQFIVHCNMMAPRLSQPSIMIEANYRDGTTVILDDFREAYWWLRDNTPEDSRVLAWWDYGYQINGIANRTSVADGNTWNHEHIGLLGRALVSNVKESHKIVRHLADYVLVWSTRYGGMMGDDIAKSPHMARISGSVFPEKINPDAFYMGRDGKPSKMMADSLVYTLVTHKMDPNTPDMPAGTYEEAYSTKHRMVRIYKVLNVSGESKAYVAEGRGKKAYLESKPSTMAYPPALRSILKEQKAFRQLEDFNRED
jgi:dolichyl-diphosphooligosaccharide--protein glycosyltransferase